MLPTRPYLEQAERWPRSGRHILAHYDETSIVVYQAYRAPIGRYAVAHSGLGGSDFSFAHLPLARPATKENVGLDR